MTDTIRDLLISLASHMAYMQGQLEAGLVLYDPEHYYWYRESVLLRQKVTDALADGPAVPDGREPASVVGEPSDEDLWNTADLVFQANSWPTDAIRYARAVLARWGNPAPQPPAEGEVAELMRLLGSMAAEAELADQVHDASVLDHAAELLQRLSPPQPVPVSERLPRAEDCDAEGRCWLRGKVEGDWRLLDPNNSGVPQLKYCFTHWLPAHALSIPHQQETAND